MRWCRQSSRGMQCAMTEKKCYYNPWSLELMIKWCNNSQFNILARVPYLLVTCQLSFLRICIKKKKMDFIVLEEGGRRPATAHPKCWSWSPGFIMDKMWDKEWMHETFRGVTGTDSKGGWGFTFTSLLLNNLQNLGKCRSKWQLLEI